jgi:nitrile hydratase
MARQDAPRALFSPGDKVLIDARPVQGHCRTPWYLRGREGVVVEILGRFRDPERLAYHKPGLPVLTLYKVRFRQQELWPGYGGNSADTLEADIYEPWLSPARAAASRSRSAGTRKRKAGS